MQERNASLQSFLLFWQWRHPHVLFEEHALFQPPYIKTSMCGTTCRDEKATKKRLSSQIEDVRCGECDRTFQRVGKSFKMCDISKETIYNPVPVRQKNPQTDRFSAVSLLWRARAGLKNKSWCSFLKKTGECNKTHTHTHKRRCSHKLVIASWNDKLTAHNCLRVAQSQKLRGIFDLTVHAEAILQKRVETTKFYCALFSSAALYFIV